MKVLLISMQSNIDTIGLKYIHSYLCKNGKESSILFIPDYKDFPPIEEFLKQFKPKIIGISLMTPEFYQVKELTINIKKIFPEVKIVWGGIHPTIEAEECLKFADYVLVGEGEKSFLGIVNNKPITSIPNLAYKSFGEVIINKSNVSLDLDCFAFPEHFPKKSFILYANKVVKLSKGIFRKYAKYSGRNYSLITSRGCPFSCSYCCNSFFSKLYGNDIRRRSVKNVINELKLAVKLHPKLEYINIHDDCFLTYSINWLKEFAKEYKEHINVKMIIRTTPTHVTDKKIKLLKEANLSWVSVGLQTGSENINKNIYNRFVTNKQFLEAVKINHKYKVAGYYDVIVDNPYETEKDLIKTINILLKIPKPYMLELHSLFLFKGTTLYERALKDNLTIKNPLDKDISKYKPIFLNKIMRICPVFPNQFIRFLIRHKESRVIQKLVSFVHFISTFLELWVLVRLTFKINNYNVFRTINNCFLSFKTAIYRSVFMIKNEQELKR